MNLKKTLAVINQMQMAGVIGPYAIGGAVGASFYLEPIATLDVDVFVAIQPEDGAVVVSPKPIYDYLIAHGCRSEGEYLIIEGWPVQFLPPTGPLVEEALSKAREIDADGAHTFVFSAEHLAAIALQTGRAKDKARVLQFVEAGVLDQPQFHDILKRHELLDRWHEFERQFLASD